MFAVFIILPMGVFERIGLPSPRECPGMIGILVSFLGAAGSFWALVMYDRAIWGFTLLALFAALGWTSFIWCGIWAQSTPEERMGSAYIGVIAGGIGFGVGLIFVIVFGGPTWSYAIVILSFVVFAGSLALWG